MKKLSLCFLILISCLIVFGSCATIPAGFIREETGNLYHTLSGTYFPESINGYERIDRSATALDSNGCDVSIQYRMMKPYQVQFSVLISPAVMGFDEYYETSKASILAVHPDADLLYENKDGDFKYVCYIMAIESSGNWHIVVYTSAIYKEKGWFVTRKVISPAAHKKLSSEDLLKEVLDSIPEFKPQHPPTSPCTE